MNQNQQPYQQQNNQIANKVSTHLYELNNQIINSQNQGCRKLGVQMLETIECHTSLLSCGNQDCTVQEEKNFEMEENFKAMINSQNQQQILRLKAESTTIITLEQALKLKDEEISLLKSQITELTSLSQKHLKELINLKNLVQKKQKTAVPIIKEIPVYIQKDIVVQVPIPIYIKQHLQKPISQSNSLQNVNISQTSINHQKIEQIPYNLQNSIKFQNLKQVAHQISEDESLEDQSERQIVLQVAVEIEKEVIIQRILEKQIYIPFQVPVEIKVEIDKIKEIVKIVQVIIPVEIPIIIYVQKQIINHQKIDLNEPIRQQISVQDQQQSKIKWNKTFSFQDQSPKSTKQVSTYINRQIQTDPDIRVEILTEKTSNPQINKQDHAFNDYFSEIDIHYQQLEYNQKIIQIIVEKIVEVEIEREVVIEKKVENITFVEIPMLIQIIKEVYIWRPDIIKQKIEKEDQIEVQKPVNMKKQDIIMQQPKQYDHASLKDYQRKIKCQHISDHQQSPEETHLTKDISEYANVEPYELSEIHQNYDQDVLLLKYQEDFQKIQQQLNLSQNNVNKILSEKLYISVKYQEACRELEEMKRKFEEQAENIKAFEKALNLQKQNLEQTIEQEINHKQQALQRSKELEIMIMDLRSQAYYDKNVIMQFEQKAKNIQKTKQLQINELLRSIQQKNEQIEELIIATEHIQDEYRAVQKQKQTILQEKSELQQELLDLKRLCEQKNLQEHINNDQLQSGYRKFIEELQDSTKELKQKIQVNESMYKAQIQQIITRNQQHITFKNAKISQLDQTVKHLELNLEETSKDKIQYQKIHNQLKVENKNLLVAIENSNKQIEFLTQQLEKQHKLKIKHSNMSNNIQDIAQFKPTKSRIKIQQISRQDKQLNILIDDYCHQLERKQVQIEQLKSLVHSYELDIQQLHHIQNYPQDDTLLIQKLVFELERQKYQNQSLRNEIYHLQNEGLRLVNQIEMSRCSITHNSRSITYSRLLEQLEEFEQQSVGGQTIFKQYKTIKVKYFKILELTQLIKKEICHLEPMINRHGRDMVDNIKRFIRIIQNNEANSNSQQTIQSSSKMDYEKQRNFKSNGHISGRQGGRQFSKNKKKSNNNLRPFGHNEHNIDWLQKQPGNNKLIDINLQIINEKAPKYIKCFIAVKLLEFVIDLLQRQSIDNLWTQKFILQDYSPLNIGTVHVTLAKGQKSKQKIRLYQAPEILVGQPQSATSYSWTMGIIIDKLFHGRLFYNKFADILSHNDNYFFEDTGNTEIGKIIERMIVKNREKRVTLEMAQQQMIAIMR